MAAASEGSCRYQRLVSALRRTTCLHACTNVNYLDERLEAVKGYSSGWPDYQARIVPLSYKYMSYWSSTPVSGENNTAVYQYITPDKPNVAIKGNRNDPYLPRPILVF